MIHGKTKIELYNPNTRIKQVYRDENVFQSAMVAKYMRSLGRAGQRLRGPSNTTDYNYGYSWKNILGGIFLFKDEIEEGEQYMPAGNVMVGNGSYGVVNNGNPTELGSFNDSESSESASAITQVYDFGTSQANGEISCVCLTSQIGGHIGYGNASGTSFDTRKSFYDGFDLSALGGGQALRNNCRYSFAYYSPTLTITKNYVPITKGSIRDGLTETITFDMVADYNLPANAGLTQFCQNGKYVTFCSNNAGVEVGGTFYYYQYDMDTETLTRKSFTNSATTVMYPYYGFSVADGIAYVTHVNNVVNMYDVETSELLKTNVGGFGYKYAGGLIIMSVGNYPYFYDKTNDTIYPTNGAFLLGYNAGYQYYYDDTSDVIYNRQYNDNMLVANNPLYLATINNLETPVTKTAAQTMKVTYTLTEEEPE